MEEFLELKDLLIKGDLKGALAIAEELEEMSRDDKITAMGSDAVILLLHLIKQQVENRTTRSWDLSIRNSARVIQRKNKRRQAGGYYLKAEELHLTLEEVYEDALDNASLEVAEGRYDAEELAQMVNHEVVMSQAMALISPSS